MRCERVQELILTDYTDRALDEKLAREIDEHIRSCDACREFKRAAGESAVQPFRAARSAEAPSYIWERVKQKIAAETPARVGILDNIFWSLGRIPKPAVAFAAAAALIIAVLIARPIAQTRAANEYMAEQISFMMQADIIEGNGNGELFY